MQRKRLAFDSIFIVTSIALFSVILVLFERSLPTNELNQGSILQGFTTAYSIFFYFGIIIIYLIYGWSLRRWFLKKEIEEKDNSLRTTYLVSGILFLVITVNYIIVYFLPLNPLSFYVRFTIALFEILQITVLSTTFGILLYPQIESGLGPLIFKENLQADDRQLGLASVQKQVSFHAMKYWKILMIIFGLGLIISNLLLFIIYPSIPVANDESLSLFYPNFNYHYNPSTGYRQDFFTFTSLTSSILIDWKLVQSILSLVILVFIFLMIYLPSKEKPKSQSEDTIKYELPKEETSQENIAYNVLTPSVDLKEYKPSHQITTKSENWLSKIYNRTVKSDFIGVMTLLCLNFALATLIIFIFQNLGLVNVTSLQLEEQYNTLYKTFTQLYWAGFGEEISFRWLIFGLPLFIIYGVIYLVLHLVKSRVNKEYIKEENNENARFLEKIYSTNPLLYLIGGWKRIDFIGIILLIFSALTFGYVHYANGWGSWKIFQAGVAGLIFGYSYIRYGFHSAIFLHAANDFLIGFVLVPNYGLIISGEYIYLILTFLGALVLFYFVVIVLTKFFKGINLLFHRYNNN